METKRWKLLVSGRVQGVYYRASTVQEASRLGVLGYARNLADGRVEVVAEGTDAQLSQLKAWCQQGPDAAIVKSVEITEQPATGEFSDFGIRH